MSSSRRARALGLLALGTATALLTSCAGSGPGGGSADGTVRVGLVCGGMTPMTGQIAINADTFGDGLEIEKFCFNSGSEGVQAMVGGSLDVFLGSVEHALSTRAQGLSVRAYAGINNQAPYSLVARADGDVESVADLTGEKVGVTEPGSLSDTELQVAAQEEGVEYDDLEVIGAGSGSTMAAAMDRDQVAAGMVSEPQRSQLIETGDYRMVWEPTEPYAAIVVLADSDWVGENESTMTDFLGGLEEAADLAVSDPEEATAAMEEEEFPVDASVLQEAVEKGAASIPEDLVVTEEVYDGTTGLLVEVGVLEEDAVAPYDEVFDLSLLSGTP